MDSISHQFVTRLAVVVLCCLCLTGCDYVSSFFGEKQPTKPATAAKPKPKKQEDPAKAPPPPPVVKAPPRVLSLSMTPPVSAKECLIKLTAAAGSVPAILQVATFADASSQSYPSVFIQATAPSGIVKEILEQPLEARVFVARGPKGPYFATPEGQSAQLTLTVADDVHVAGKLENATLVDPVSGQRVTASGTFDGKLK